MREILFRGKRVNGDEWIDGDSLIHSALKKGDVCIGVTDGMAIYEVIPETIGQYTGLTDKNGKKIFEGDVCRFREWSKGEMCWIGKVYWEHQQFMISGGRNKECETEFVLCMSRFIPENIEVMGNIYDNPELLEGGKTCKDCYHYDVCMDYTSLKESEFAQNFNGSKVSCNHFKNKLQVVELPCKTGDTVNRTYTRSWIGEDIASHFLMNEWGLRYVDDNGREASCDIFNKTVFPTREEAEKALKEYEKL